MSDLNDEKLIGYVLRYGGMCRDCADMDGVCQNGMPCDIDQRKAVVRHTVSALDYGIKNGFVKNPFAADEIDRLTRELAEARDKALDEAALRIDCNCNERCLASHEGYCPKQTVAAIRALKEKP